MKDEIAQLISVFQAFKYRIWQSSIIILIGIVRRRSKYQQYNFQP